MVLRRKDIPGGTPALEVFFSGFGSGNVFRYLKVESRGIGALMPADANLQLGSRVSAGTGIERQKDQKSTFRSDSEIKLSGRDSIGWRERYDGDGGEFGKASNEGR